MVFMPIKGITQLGRIVIQFTKQIQGIKAVATGCY